MGKKKFSKKVINDSFNLYVSHARWILPRLKYLRKHGHGYPGYMSVKEWEAVLDDMIRGFKIIAKDEINNDEQDRKALVAINLFAKHYYALWD